MSSRATQLASPRLLLRRARGDDLDAVHSITADVDPLNVPCLNLLTRAGFVETGTASGTFTVGQRLCDSIYLRLDLQQSAARNL